MKQFTLVPARDRRLLGYLFDAKTRAEVINGINSQIRNNVKSVGGLYKFIDELKESNDLEEAIKDPNGDLAKQIEEAATIPKGRRIPSGRFDTHQCSSP